MGRRLPVLPESLLDDIRIATPCSADWNAMPGDERVRHCPECRLNVYNVAAMSRRDAGLLIQQKEGRLCVRLHRRADGTLITADCWDKLRAARRRGRLAFACAIVLVCLIHVGIRFAAVRMLLARFADGPAPIEMRGEAQPARPMRYIPQADSAPLAPPRAMGRVTMGGPKAPPSYRLGKLRRNPDDPLLGGL